jgi:hypothetical protein
MALGKIIKSRKVIKIVGSSVLRSKFNITTNDARLQSNEIGHK